MDVLFKLRFLFWILVLSLWGTMFRQFYFDESFERFRRTANLITTRSNVFEIKVRVQSGYVTDVNGDGILNYRDDNEFTVTGEKDARAIYER